MCIALFLLVFNFSVEVLRVYDPQFYTVKEVKMLKAEKHKKISSIESTKVV